MIRNRSAHINILCLLNFVFAGIAGIVSVSLATFLFNVLLVLFGMGCIHLMAKDAVKRQSSYTIFLSFFLVYGTYMMITNQLFVQDPFKDIFYAKDSVTFYTYVDKVSGAGSIGEIGTYYRNDFFANDWKGFAYFSTVVAFIAKGIDINSLLLQKLQIVACSSAILVILYNLLANYITDEYSVRMTVIYGFLSYNFFYSAIYLRDVHIGLFFGLYFLLIVFRKGFAGIFYGLLLTVVIFFFRPEHGYFSVSFLFAYIYLLVTDKNNVTANKFKIPILIMLALPALTQIAVLQEGLNTIQNTSDSYRDFSSSSAGLGSFGSMLLRLPFGVRHIAVGLFSQTLPFPFYSVWEENLFFIPWSVAAVFWFVVWVVIIYTSLVKPRNPLFQFKELNILFAIAILLILGASANADTRRIMSVYPVVFVIFSGGILSLAKARRKQLVARGLLFYFTLIFAYALIK
ncbi:hypothetical protein HGH93_12795 [Chitinophaga polysaccharea]|uniref:hypothetical protein n=1 Tax=Chitinophaga TaxID=79328 RepID=UPI0014559400|nr:MULTISPECIES: hypothetical protein [Chitinophaga]NLR58985.1 hypothetical protein [Chitinophaga polysaccharea]NLU92230.1 hypothetical protein [Chitinophaga sp. Ak27]